MYIINQRQKTLYYTIGNEVSIPSKLRYTTQSTNGTYQYWWSSHGKYSNRTLIGRQNLKIYADPDKYYLFNCTTCVMNAMFKTKWKNWMISKHYDYIDVSNKDFAFLLRENNGLRYMDMTDKDNDTTD